MKAKVKPSNELWRISNRLRVIKDQADNYVPGLRRKVVEEVESMIENKVNDFNRVLICQSVGIYNKLTDAPNQRIIKLVCEKSKYQLGSFGPAELGNVIYLISKSGYSDLDFAEKWVEAALPHLWNFNSTDLMMSIYGLAKLGYRDEEFLTTWAEVAVQRIYEFNSKDYPTVLWALSRLDYRHESFMAEWSKAASIYFHEYGEIGLNNLSWAMETLHFYDEAIVEKIFLRIRELMAEGDLAPLSNCLANLDKFGYRDAQLNYDYAKVFKERCRTIKDSDFARAALVFGHLEIVDPDLVGFLVDFLKEKYDVLTTDDKINLFWILAKNNYQDDWILEKIKHSANALIGADNLSLVNQFITAICYYDLEQAIDPVKYQNAISLIVSNNYFRFSNFQLRIKLLLEKMNYQFKEEVFCAGYFMDFVVNIGGRVINLESDGKRFHKFKDSLREKLLTKRGYQIVRLTDQEFFDSKDKEGLLKSLLG